MLSVNSSAKFTKADNMTTLDVDLVHSCAEGCKGICCNDKLT